MRSSLLLRAAFPALVAVLMARNSLTTTTAFVPSPVTSHHDGAPRQRTQQQQQRHPHKRTSTTTTSTTTTTTTQLFVFERMSQDCIAAVVTAQKQSDQLQLPAVGPPVMLAGCIDHPETPALKRTLQQYRITWRQVQKTLVEMYQQQQQQNDDDDDDDDNDVKSKSKSKSKSKNAEGWLSGFRAAQQQEERPFDKALQQTFVKAAKLADQMGSPIIQTHHVFLALLDYQEDGHGVATAATTTTTTTNDDDDHDAWAVLRHMQTLDEIITALDICQSLLQHLDNHNNNNSHDDRELVTGLGDSKTTPTLANVGQDLTQQAADGLLDPVYGRQDEIRSCLRTLVRRRKNNVCLIGEAGVGKVRARERESAA